MDKWTFGTTLLVIGAGGTFITLGILILFTNILKKVFPQRKISFLLDTSNHDHRSTEVGLCVAASRILIHSPWYALRIR